MSKSVRPLFDKILIELEEETLSTGGIVLVGEPNERQQRGRVLAVGEGRRDTNGGRIPPQVKPGDRVLFDKWSMVELKIDKQSVFLAIEDGIIGILDEE